MKKIILLILSSLFVLILATPFSPAKELKQRKKIVKIAPVEFIKAGYELFTFTPPQPNVVIVEKIVVNGRVTIRQVKTNHDKMIISDEKR